jgi:hypothetical protein
LAAYPEYQPPIRPSQWANYRVSHKIAASWGIQHGTVLRLFAGKPGVLTAYVTDKDGVQREALLIPHKTANAIRAKLWAFLAPSIDMVERV